MARIKTRSMASYLFLTLSAKPSSAARIDTSSDSPTITDRSPGNVASRLVATQFL